MGGTKSYALFSVAVAFTVALNPFVLPALAEQAPQPLPATIAPYVGTIPGDNSGPQATAAPDGTSAEAGTAGPSTDSAPQNGDQTASSGDQSKLKVDGIKIEGNRLVDTQDILGVVKTKPGDQFDRDQVMQDLKAINGLGYFDDRSLQVVPERTDGGVLLKIRVQENAPVSQFSFQGNHVLSSEDISKVFSDQLGRPQNLTQLSAAIDKVEQAYHEKGFVLARVTDVKDDPDGSVGLTINEGTIDSIQISGNRKTKDYIIRNKIKLKPGSVYNERLLATDLRKLYGDGYFSDIRRSLVPSTTDPDKYTLKVEVDEKRSGSISLGGGMDSMAGPFGSLNFSDNNFRGTGQVLSFNSQVGTGMFGQLNNVLNNAGTTFLPNQRTYNVQASWVEPNLFGSDTSMSVTGFGRDMASMVIQQSMQQTLGATVNFSQNLGNGFSANLGFTGENTILNDVASQFQNQDIMNSVEQRAVKLGMASTPAQAVAVAQQYRNAQLKGGAYLSVSPSIAHDTRDRAIDPTKGSLVRLTATPSLGLTGSSFVKLGVSASKFIPINDSTTLALNVQAGDGLGSMPQFAQFRLGGFNGMRGYRAFSDLGTGTSMLMATAETRTRIPGLKHSENKVARIIDKHVKFATFVDFGGVGGNSVSNSLFSTSNMGASIGIGIRVNVPMLGMVRIDYGFPILSTIMGHFTPRISFGFGERF